MQADFQNVAYKEINISMKLEILIDNALIHRCLISTVASPQITQALFLDQSIFLQPSLFPPQLPSEFRYKSLNREQ